MTNIKYAYIAVVLSAAEGLLKLVDYKILIIYNHIKYY